MRIGIVSPEFPPDFGGVETYAYEYAKALSSLDYEVSVFTRRRATEFPYREPFKVFPELRLRRRLDAVTLKQHDKDIDVWHVMNAAQAWLCGDTDKPVIVSVHGNDFLDPYQLMSRLDFERFPLAWRYKVNLNGIDRQLGRWLTRASVKKWLPKATRIITNSVYTERVLLEKFPECSGRTTAALVGLGEKFRDIELEAKPCQDRFQLVTISRLSEPRKNIHRVLHALSRLKDEYPFSYTVIGDGYLKTELETLAEQLGLANRVDFAGRVSDQQMIDELKRSDLFILTSAVTAGSHEGFGIVYLEAAACGTPVLAARLAGAVEALEEGISGMFVDTPSVEELEIALRRLFDGDVSFDPHQCREFANRFNWKDVVNTVIPYYQPANYQMANRQ